MPSKEFLRRMRTRAEREDQPSVEQGDFTNTPEAPNLTRAEDLVGGPVVEVRQDFVAVRLYSRLLDRELWVCRDSQAAAEIAVEFPGMPTLTFAEVPHLHGKPPELLNALLDTKAAFPDARLRA